jgi:hypothetical protein
MDAMERMAVFWRVQDTSRLQTESALENETPHALPAQQASSHIHDCKRVGLHRDKTAVQV